MGIFSRFADIINSNISSLLDKAEEPEKMIRLIIQEMEDTLVEVRTNSARSLADKKELARKIKSMTDLVSDWQQKATLALVKQREDLARSALIEKQKVEDLLKGLHQEQELVEETIDKLAGEIAKLESKIAETRAKQQALTIRSQTAFNRRDVQKQMHSGRTNEAMAKFEQYSRKVDELEAEADTYAQAGQNKSLDQEFAELKAQDDIEKELEKLKQQVEQNKTSS
ncbi:phage shock protein PspA [Vibrio sp. 10N.286.49.B3]|uniref:phage shock protein PspA n=1 Tax=Vibrio sp. 10N.286.49.B3 TaxID=1880855 RepID=UPI000C83106B|nr:phage shock protein PspA [Vibrio sp. 10N.286.49.B3]PMH46723.1 phage shock protein PspA [Vibrio sp. 10N.286.49.B3]